ncbi:hypothetical protein NPIL_451491 [Nephila pilipes]|uniref:Uncharacterized protein n=1 Tax=Nephila pilipes TaxID=299642 RepID=A0A8X6UJQ5_NEPPI|nr:hypothetical protein NPIL_451491 [Nephila pilipes]
MHLPIWTFLRAGLAIGEEILIEDTIREAHPSRNCWFNSRVEGKSPLLPEGGGFVVELHSLRDRTVVRRLTWPIMTAVSKAPAPSFGKSKISTAFG